MVFSAMPVVPELRQSTLSSLFSSSLLAGAVVLASAGLLSACGRPSPQELLAQGTAALERNDGQAAIVHFKGLIEADPASIAGRLALAEALLSVGDGPGALVEAERAVSLGASTQQYALVLARALSATDRNKELIERLEQVNLEEAKGNADLRVLVANALFVEGEQERGSSVLDGALRSDPQNKQARLSSVRLMATRGNFANALQSIDSIIQEYPKSAEALHLKGLLLQAEARSQEDPGSLFKAAVEIDPKYVPAYSPLIDWLISKNDLLALEQVLAGMRSALPTHPELRFAEVQVALLRGDLKAAKESIDRLVVLAPESVRVQYLAGVVNFRLGAILAAEGHLFKAVQLGPELPAPRRLLAEALIENGNPARALEVLMPLLADPRADGSALRIAGRAEMQRGRAAEAESFYRRALQANPADVESRTAIGLTKLSSGDLRGGFAQLEATAASTGDLSADMALIAARLARGETELALRSIAALEAKAPTLPDAPALRGRVQMNRGERDAARVSFEQALKLDPMYYPAVLGIVEIDVTTGQVESGLSRLESFVGQRPRNYAALLRLTQLREAAGAPAEATLRSIQSAIQANPGDSAPRVLLIDFHLARQDVSAALIAAQQGVSAVRDDPDLEDALGRVTLEAGDARRATASFVKVVAARPASAQAHLRLGSAQWRAGEILNARQSFIRAAELEPRAPEPVQALVALELAERRYAEALSYARGWQKRFVAMPLGFMLEADVFLSQGNHVEAARAMKAAFDRQPNSAVAMRYHALQVAGKRFSDADRFAAEWLRANPRDADFFNHLGSIALQRSDFPGAEAQYRRAVEIRPDDALALNNLAWSLLQQKKPGALEPARRANQLAPNQPRMMNTLAAALRAAGNNAEAIEWQRKSVAASNGEPRYRLQLAEMLVASGDKSGAREQLQALEALGDNFPQRDRVQELLKAAR